MTACHDGMWIRYNLRYFNNAAHAVNRRAVLHDPPYITEKHTLNNDDRHCQIKIGVVTI